MGLLEVLEKIARCPNDGTRLEGKTGWCRVCRSNWIETYHAGGDPIDNRDFLRRKIRELEAHRLSPLAPPPHSLAARQGGHATFRQTPQRAGARAWVDHAQWQAERERARLIQRKAGARDVDTPIVGRVF